jgi:UDPglucose 6-dehydrogenase
MKLGIIGLGVVGSANYAGFELLKHEVLGHDTKFKTTVKDVIEAEIVFVCVPTPSFENGSCDTTIVKSVISELNEHDFGGIIAIRSSTVPGFTKSMQELYPKQKICFVPEFVRERCALDDFVKDHQMLAIGTTDQYVFNKVKEAHGDYPKNVVMLRPTEAEILKYFLNLYAATRVTFANMFYEIADKMKCDYSAIKNAYIKTGRAGDMYLDVNEDLRGYGGMCLPKDTRAIIQLMQDLNLDFDFFKTMDKDNKKFKTTVFSGMRNEGTDTSS